MAGCAEVAGRTEVVDAATFMGMHAHDEPTRMACKTFFVERMGSEVLMSLEHVGWCDDIVWRRPRSIQDAYYPFMDTLHSAMAIRRLSYDEADLDAALHTPALRDLPIRQRLLMGMVLRREAILHTADASLVTREDLPVVAVRDQREQPFPAPLERLYQASLVLRTAPEPG